MKNVRLLKVLIQPTFVIDDGETLEELTCEKPFEVPAVAWANFPSDLETLRQNMEAHRNDSTDDPPNPAPLNEEATI